MARSLHHAALCPGDLDVSLRFYRDGLGLEVLMDHGFDGDWPQLFGVGSGHLRSIFLGDPDGPDAGVVELVDFGEERASTSGAGAPLRGFFLLSFNVDLDATLDRLRALGVELRSRITVHGVDMAVVLDPDGTRVELIDLP